MIATEVSASPINQFWIPVSMYREVHNCLSSTTHNQNENKDNEKDHDEDDECTFKNSPWQVDRKVYHAPWEGGRTRIGIVHVHNGSVNVSVIDEHAHVVNAWSW